MVERIHAFNRSCLTASISDDPLYRVRIPDEIDVRAIRKKMDMTQEKFAAVFGVSIAVVRDWEQGRRTPSTSDRALLKIIAHEPEAVQRALAT